jgi:putative PIN family toxin of toxin-antitoxin system
LAWVEQQPGTLLLSKPILSEYRTVLTDPVIVDRYPELEAERVEVALRRLKYYSEYLQVVRVRFEFARDPRDAMLLELAIAAKATHLLSHDNDLLSLPTAHTDAAKRLRQRLPKLVIQTSGEFLASATTNS